MSLNAIASPAAREPGPLVILLRLRTVAKVDSIVILSRSPVRCADLVIRVVDGVHDVSTGVVGGGSSRGQLLANRDVFGVGCRGAGRGRGRVGFAGVDSRRRVHGCGAALSRRWSRESSVARCRAGVVVACRGWLWMRRRGISSLRSV